MQVTGFNDELARRLEALDRGKAAPPSESRARLKRKSLERRKMRA
jgi:hypothetical protein